MQHHIRPTQYIQVFHIDQVLPATLVFSPIRPLFSLFTLPNRSICFLCSPVTPMYFIFLLIIVKYR